MPAGRDRKGMEGQGRQDWCPSAVAILLCKLWGLAVGKQRAVVWAVGKRLRSFLMG